MKGAAIVLVAMILAIISATSLVVAQVDDSVTASFRLKLTGDIPEDQSFALMYGTPVSLEAGEPMVVGLCGPNREVNILASTELCVGNGAEYTYDVEVPDGTQLAFAFARTTIDNPQQPVEYFAASFEGEAGPQGEKDFVLLHRDTELSTNYVFGASGQPVIEISHTSGRGSLDLAVGLTALAVLGAVAASSAWLFGRESVASSPPVRLGSVAGLIGGSAWVLKFVAIAVTGGDRQLQPFEGILYVVGWLGFIGGLAAIVTIRLQRRGRWTKAAAFVLGLPIMAIATIAIIDVLKAAASPVYEGFLADEFGILLIGIVWLLIGLALSTKQSWNVSQPVAA